MPDQTDDYMHYQELVAFIHCESGTDLIVSFALRVPDALAGIESLILTRTPKYEGLLYERERGVLVSFERDDTGKDVVVLLRSVALDDASKIVTVRTDEAVYELDVRNVEPQELRRMGKVLRKMNFDSCMETLGV